MTRAEAFACLIEESSGACVLDHLGRQFDELAERCAAPLTNRRPWLSAWIEAHADFQPWLITAWHADQLVGVCALARRRNAGALEIVGLGHERNDRSRFLADNDRVAAELADAVAERLRALRERWTLRIEQLPVSDPTALQLAVQLSSLRLVDGGDIPQLMFDGTGSVDTRLSTNLRRQLQKCRNRIATDGLPTMTHFTREAGTIARLLQEIEPLRRARDLDMGRCADAGLETWRGVIHRHMELGEVEVGVLYLQGALAAYVIAFIDGSAYRVYDGKCATAWARYSPGRLIEFEALARAMADGGFTQLDWMNSIAPDKLLSYNALESTQHLVGAMG